MNNGFNVFDAERHHARTIASRDQHPLWSVIVIARNEEASICMCLESVMKAFAGLSCEVIFVDSASTDRTVDIASRFPIKIIRLPPTVPLSPSAGRHIGFLHSHGQWILFLDGDSTLKKSWLDEAEKALNAEKQVGGVAGDMEQVLPKGGIDNRVTVNKSYPDSDYREANFLAGSAAYKREALMMSGGFNPFLRSCEEIELGARMRTVGYRLLRLRHTMTWHFPKHVNDTAPELIRRMRRGFFIGMGQFVRYCYSQHLLVARPYVLILRYIEMFVLLVLGVIASIASVFWGNWYALLGWVSVMMIIFVLFVVRSGSVRRAAYYFLTWSLACPMVIWGILERPRRADEFCNVLDSDDPEGN